MKTFNLHKMQKKGESGKKLVSVAVGVLLLGIFAPLSLSLLFNTSKYTCHDWNVSPILNGTFSCITSSGIGAWVPLVLGALGVVVFVYALLPSGK